MIQNSVLAAVPRKEQRLLLAGLEEVTLTFGDVLYEPGDKIHHVYFPVTSLISLLVLADGHLALEVGLIGRDGMVGIPLILGHERSPVRALVQGSGPALRMTAAHLLREFRLSAPLRKELYRYTHALMAQTAVCNRHHTVEQQLCRWLLLSLDRLPSNELVMTQKLIANMLGVRREGVTEAAGRLQAARLIDYSRGKIVVLDRPGLEARVCECYAVVKRESDRLLDGIAIAGRFA